MKINTKQYKVKDNEESSTGGAEGGHPFYGNESKRFFYVNTLYQTMCFHIRMFFNCSPACEAVAVLKWLAIFKILLYL